MKVTRKPLTLRIERVTASKNDWRRTLRTLHQRALLIALLAFGALPLASGTARADSPQALSAVSLSSVAAGATGVSWSFRFATSAHGALEAFNGAIIISGPAGATLPGCAKIIDVTTGTDVGGCGGGHEGSVSYRLDKPVAAGDRLEMTFAVTNPPAGRDHRLTVATTSDTTAAHTPAFKTVPAAAVRSLSAVSLSSVAAGATGVSWSFRFATSAHGALEAFNGAIIISGPAGATLPGCAKIIDVTTGTDVGGCGGGHEGSVSYRLDKPVAAGDRLEMTFAVTNPPAGRDHRLTVATTSDTTAAHTPAFKVLPSTTIAGTVTDRHGAVVRDAKIQACPLTGDGCYLATSDPGGKYSILVAASHTYRLEARGAGGTGTAGPLTLGKKPRTGSDLRLEELPIPAGVTIDGQTSGVPNLIWSYPSPITVQGCPNGIGLVTVTAQRIGSNQDKTVVAALIERPRGSGRYTGTAPPLAPAHGNAKIRTSFYCFRGTMPKAGPSAGGTTVNITGRGFSGATQVMFGAKPALSFRVVSDELIEAVAPPGTGSVAVSVVTPSGTTPQTSDDVYDYFTLTAASGHLIATDSIRALVTVTGSGLAKLDFIALGSQIGGSDIIAATDSQITFLAPPGGDIDHIAGAALGEDPADYASGSVAAVMGQPPIGGSPGARRTAAHTFEPLVDAAHAVRAHRSSACSECRVTSHRATAGSGPSIGSWAKVASGVWGAAKSLQKGMKAIQIAEGAGYAFTPLLEFLGADAASVAILGAALPYVVAAGVGVWVGYLIYKSIIKPSHLLDAYIDPSGTIVDTHGNPISRATVRISRSSTRYGPQTSVAANDPVLKPSVNPETTGPDGVFHWDVLSGYYQVAASAPGCSVPGDNSAAVARTPVLPVPPPQVGILIVLSCHAEPPAPRPRVASLSPAVGPAVGGGRILVNGSGFTPASSVSFGRRPATHVTFLSPQALSAMIPSGSGTRHVIVSTSAGVSASSHADRYTYQQAPDVELLHPRTGSSLGGNTIKILGSGFLEATDVRFGTKRSPSWQIHSDTQITAIVPTERPGTVHVIVSAFSGKSSATSEDRFTLRSAPWVFTRHATAIAVTTATLNGTLHPEGVRLTHCRFDYGPTTAYGRSAPCATIPLGGTAVPVSAGLTGLSAASGYHFRLVASTHHRALHGGDRTFATTSVPNATVATAADRQPRSPGAGRP
jgi:hypothetical protein